MARYDDVGRTYTATRRQDPRIMARIAEALDDARSVVNVGAGAGSYEPPQTVAAVDPSLTMLRQRPAHAAPALMGSAERLPLSDGSVDAAMAILTIHHWADLAAGIAEMRRVARRRLVFFTWRPEQFSTFWLLQEYLPAAAKTDMDLAVPMTKLESLLDRPRVLAVPVPYDCADGFAAAYWRRPEAYLDAAVRAGMSLFTMTGADDVRSGLARLAGDLDSGAWYRRHADLLERASLDVGYCLVVADA